MTEMNRRDALKVIAAAGAAATATDCARDQEANRMTPKTSEESQAVLAVKPLGFPWETRDPFIFCVHHDDHYPAGNERMGPAASLAGRNLGMDFEGKDGWRMYHGRIVPGFPQHPHRGFETVTVVRRGLLDHSDSLGAAARYGGGDVQWLTAGKGIIHAEMFPLIDQKRENALELFQIWLNLPRARKLVDPHFSMLWSHTIPKHVVKDATGKAIELTLMAGRFGELRPPSPPPSSWAAQPDTDVAIWTIKLAADARWSLPRANPGTNRTLYFFRGSGLRVGGREIPRYHQVELRSELDVALASAGEEVEMLLLQGKPINEPVVQYGPFVMNSREEIRQAYMDYERTQFGGWPWQGDDPVHPREQGRFARHADGRFEEPT